MGQTAEDDDSSFLVVLIETHQSLWSELSEEGKSEDSRNLSLTTLFHQVLVFFNSFVSLNEANDLAVIAICGDKSHVLHAPRGEGRGSQPPVSHGGLCEGILSRLSRLLQSQAAKQGRALENPAVLAGALSRALCLISKAQHGGRGGTGGKRRSLPRILCLQSSPDAAEQYIAVMNAIFAAQRSEVIIDACMLGSSDSTFLQQATHLTGGVYLHPRHRTALLQYLLMVYCGDAFSRSFLQLPKPLGVDFRASCFCHRRAIDLGYVCSVCLSIFCESVQECSTCGTQFKSAQPSSSRSAPAGLKAL